MARSRAPGRWAPVYRTAVAGVAASIIAAGAFWTALIIAGYPKQASTAATGVAVGGIAATLILGFICLILEADE